jgi:hypothetical protein
MIELCWQSHRGDEWYADDATASYSLDTFTIDSFGSAASATYVLQLLKDARLRFPGSRIYVTLNRETARPLAVLMDTHLIETTTIQMTPATRVALIDEIDGCRNT